MSFLNKLFKKKIFQFIETPFGKHQLGGEVPKEFEIPKNDFLGSMQYLGYIDNTDPVFNWLPDKLNLICPIYLNFDKLYLDYSYSNNPTIIYPTDASSISTEYDGFKHDSKVIYESLRFNALQIDRIDDVDEDEIIGLAGEPNWIQDSEIPKCPKSKKKMRFVCQLKSNDHAKTIFTNVQDKHQEYFENMNFWGDGDLYIFFEPMAKTACYFIQIT